MPFDAGQVGRVEARHWWGVAIVASRLNSMGLEHRGHACKDVLEYSSR